MKLTHTGRMEGYGSYEGKRYIAKLRETPRHWITKNGIRYRKSDGFRTGSGGYSDFRLALETVVEHVENPYGS